MLVWCAKAGKAISFLDNLVTVVVAGGTEDVEQYISETIQVMNHVLGIERFLLLPAI